MLRRSSLVLNKLNLRAAKDEKVKGKVLPLATNPKRGVKNIDSKEKDRSDVENKKKVGEVKKDDKAKVPSSSAKKEEEKLLMRRRSLKLRRKNLKLKRKRGN